MNGRTRATRPASLPAAEPSDIAALPTWYRVPSASLVT